MSDEIAPHQHFQYASPDHQSDTAIAGMWLFLATEVLFFGGLLLAWMFCRHWQQAGFDAGGRETVLAIGTVNLVLLLTSSFVYVCGLIFYFVATSLHALHMIIGIGAVCWIAMQARAGRFSARWHTPVEVVGLYWSFVDIVWIILYPLIYLIGRGA
jgi:heme/copper-type cytochrome/quinol oxidase subunit 3